MRRIRSSRQLEYACGHNVDFMWLAERRTIDHDTICKFRTCFKEPLKQLFRQVGRLAMGMGFIRLLEVAFDGTRVKANASRFHCWTAEKVEAVGRELETQVGEMLSQAVVSISTRPSRFPCRKTTTPPSVKTRGKRCRRPIGPNCHAIATTRSWTSAASSMMPRRTFITVPWGEKCLTGRRRNTQPRKVPGRCECTLANNARTARWPGSAWIPAPSVGGR